MPSHLTPKNGPRPTPIFRGRWVRATVAALGSLPLAIGITASAHAAVRRAPAGAVKLPAGSIKHVRGVTCGRVKGAWKPGTVVIGHWFVTDAQQAKNYQAAARHARGGAKRADLARAKFYARRAVAHQSLCMPAPSQSGTVTTTNPTPPGTSAPTPLRFNLSGAIGLALGGTPTANAAAVAASPAARIAPAPAAVAGPTSESVQPDAVAASPQAVAAQPADAVTPSLQTVQADGQLAPAVTSGSAPISHFLIGPDGKVYVVFSTPVNLANTSQYSFGSGCVLAEIDPSSGAPRCVDSSLSVINWDIGEYHGGSAPIQFDSSGAIYYSGSTTTGQTVLRRFDGSTIRNLITDNVMLNSFAVALNGTVVITGSTTSTGATWTRRVSPSGSLASLANSGVNFTSVFPDGNVYMGTSTPWSVARYVTASDHMDPEPWIADSTNPAVANEYFDAHSLCASPTPSSSNFCMSAGAFTKWSYGSPDGHEYVVTGSVNGGGLAQYYPTVKLLPSEVTAINVAAGVGNDVALAGTNGNGQNVLTLLDPATGAERELIGPDNEIEIYHLNYGAHRNEILFDGLRFSDNQYVVGEYNLSTGQLTVSATLSSKLTDLQSF